MVKCNVYVCVFIIITDVRNEYLVCVCIELCFSLMKFISHPESYVILCMYQRAYGVLLLTIVFSLTIRSNARQWSFSQRRCF